jgi:hypothetical protein
MANTGRRNRPKRQRYRRPPKPEEFMISPASQIHFSINILEHNHEGEKAG